MAILNVSMTVGSVPLDYKPPGGGSSDGPFPTKGTDVDAENWVIHQLAEFSGGKFNSLDFGGNLANAKIILGDAWTVHGPSSDPPDRCSIDRVIQQVKQKRPVIIGIDMTHGLLPTARWHAIAIVPTPPTHPRAKEAPFTVVNEGGQVSWDNASLSVCDYDESGLRSLLNGYCFGGRGLFPTWIVGPPVE